MKMIRQSFSNPRKKLSHNLPYEKAKLEQTMKELNISENARPAELSLADYEKLYLSLAK
jgi:16S rRNA A1518/A1519 N6-dimethyltransferase RsmA/KsgA/DIM1 with predicted DNA glycosylase/AP lyase activity